ncbi:2-keto-4-pentenoate hydratase/2-oxohepta-3-ene-1,7-dioic acid hydratase [Caulobacter sp. AP07]|uniref:fumarylacetoacetate hydrolase family protein n=1 Tax=Caulobacter sp. AP07 TaxID=1144304 RepID=UPI000271E8C7|nr:fumarylacetoacetate hydrolase family protein [Caulobacter sp. AP07]EJL30770.1 2-keto-4-pentenoate hydratase/2-oxohepta-3-ene-1,7-dioic acid hydratase [Caulobacter sp. AP07]
MIAGTVYGVVLNDAVERERLGEALAAAPYGAPPVAPVVYIKPRNCVSVGGAAVPTPGDAPRLTLAATLGLLFERDLVGDDPASAAIGGACLALDVFEPHDSYYRPAIRQRCRDGFLPVGGLATRPADPALEIVTLFDGQEVHRWSLSRLVRPVDQLIADLSAFMTFRAGDLLLVGVAGDAPQAQVGTQVTVRAAGLPSLATRLVAEVSA